MGDIVVLLIRGTCPVRYQVALLQADLTNGGMGCMGLFLVGEIDPWLCLPVAPLWQMVYPSHANRNHGRHACKAMLCRCQGGGSGKPSGD